MLEQKKKIMQKNLRKKKKKKWMMCSVDFTVVRLLHNQFINKKKKRLQLCKRKSLPSTTL